jgi:DNA-binding NarL/FixJ family response regulator
MRELVLATIADQPDIDIVGEVRDENALIDSIEESQPEVLIVALDNPDKRTAQCGFLLGRYPNMRILALAPEQNCGTIYWAIVDVRTRPLESSESGLLSALRERPSLVGALNT